VEEETLLCDFHVHTSHSDGRLPMREVVDLFGRSGHDVIAITDHIADTPGLLGRAAKWMGCTLTAESAPAYFSEIAREAQRAWNLYKMVVIPGAEITRNAPTRDASCHILALGITEFLSADRSPLQILKEIRRRGAVSVACHPHSMTEWFANTFYLWNRRRRLARYIDRWEVACRWDVFPAVSAAKLPVVANGDFHEEKHLFAWKTLLIAPRTAEGVLAALKGSSRTAVHYLSGERRFSGAAAPAYA
jgi:hypothetical protein